MPKPNKRRRHVMKRMRERISSLISVKELEENLNHDNIMFAKKLTNSRSLCYIIINNIPIKFIYSKISKKAITVLEMHSDFEFPKEGYAEFHSYEKNTDSYRIKIYPDAYSETENPLSLTKFEILENNEWIEKRKVGDIFAKLFLVTFCSYEQTKNILKGTF